MYKDKLITFMLLLVLMVCPISISNAADSPEMEAAYSLFEEMGMDKLLGETIEAMVDVQINQNPKLAEYKEVLLAFFEKCMGWESLKSDMAEIYAKRFTAEELNELTDFYKRPIGKKAAKLLPVLTAEGAALGQKRVQDNILELQKMIGEAKAKKDKEKESTT